MKEVDRSERNLQQSTKEVEYKCHFCGKERHKNFILKLIRPEFTGELGKGKIIFNCSDCGASYRILLSANGIGEVEAKASKRIDLKEMNESGVLRIEI